MLTKVLLASLVLAGAAVAAERPPIVGAWEREPVPGVATIRRLTFTADGKLWAEGNQLIGAYQVAGDKVSAKSRFGETYVYELTGDGRLCVSPGPSMMPLAREGAASLAAGQCYRKLRQPA